MSSFCTIFSSFFIFHLLVFLLQKNTASFPFIVSHPSRTHLFFVFVLCRTIPAPGDAAESVLPGTARCDQRKRGRPLPGPGKPEPLRTHTGRWGFVGLRVFVIVFVWVCEFFCLSVGCFLYISIHM